MRVFRQPSSHNTLTHHLHTQLTDEDVAWSDGDDDAPPVPREAVAAAVKAAAVLAESAEKVAGGKKERVGRREKRKEKEKKAVGGDAAAPPTPKPKLSTSVGALLSPSTAGGGVASGGADLAHDGAAVLAALPPDVRSIATDLFKLAAPTRVQAAAWPPAAAGKDVLALAPPGADKTLAYLVPVAAEVLGTGDGAGRRAHTTTTSSSTSLTAVILVPTRELARQVFRDAAPLRSLARCACVYGGASRGDQVERLAGGGVRLLVATPGRLLDLVEGGVVSLGK